MSDPFYTVSKETRLSFLYKDGRLSPKELSRFLRLGRPDWANILNIEPCSIRYDSRMPDRLRDLMLQLANLCEQVAEVFDGDRHKVELWFRIDNLNLGGISPREMIRQGRHKKLAQLIAGAREG